MVKEYWYFLGGIMLILIPLALMLAAKKLDWFEEKPDRRIPYKTIGKSSLDLHNFEAAKGASDATRPAILLFHGGRWLYGSPAAFYPQCRFFAAQGYQCFSAQYRLGRNDSVDVRELVTDARDAFEFLIDNADELNIDSQKIYVGGGSSGGHLAAALGVVVSALSALENESEGEKMSRPAGLLLYNPMLDLAPGTPDYPLVEGYWHSVSPQHHIDQSVPPTLVLLGSKDPEVPVATAEAFCTSVIAAGGKCELAVYPDQGHGFFNAEPFLTRTNQRVLEFLQALEK